MPKHCPTCNRTSAEVPFYGEFCKICTEEKFAEKLPGELELTVCKRCEKVRVQGKFLKPYSSSIEMALSVGPLKNYRVRLVGGDENSAVLEITDMRPNYEVTVRKNIEIKTKKVMCEECVRRAGSYYEAVIQLRDGDADRMEKFIERITKYMERHNQFISKVKEVDNGLDVYLSNKKLTAAYLSNHDIPHVTSYTLYGLKHGKKVYRHTYSVRL